MENKSKKKTTYSELSKPGMSLWEFFAKKNSITNDITGVYVLYNIIRDKFYVGKSTRLYERVSLYFLGHTDCAVSIYEDYRNGNEFRVEIFEFDSEKFSTLDEMKDYYVSDCNMRFRDFEYVDSDVSNQKDYSELDNIHPKPGMSVQEFFDKKELITADITGIYVLYNITRDKVYVGKSTRLYERVSSHFLYNTGGSVSIYLNHRNGNEFRVEIFEFDSKRFSTLDEMKNYYINDCKTRFRGSGLSGQKGYSDTYSTRSKPGMSVEEFFDKQKKITADVTGIYVLHNITQKKCYVGQAKKVYKRVTTHLLGESGCNADVYADYKYGKEFRVEIFKFDSEKFSNIDQMEQYYIAKYNGYDGGYNKTRGNG